MGAPTPAFLPKAFGALAVDPTYINTIPTTTATPGRASFNLGFPPLTMTPIIAGGKPPFGQDMNGILYMLSTHAFASQAGQAPLWSSDISTAISGYALGTVLGSTDGSTLWFNITAANTTDPDGGSSAGWVPLISYGTTAVATTGGTTTLTPAQARKQFIVITGALVAPATIVLPTWVKDWLIINATSGAFTLTVKTAAGSGVTVLAGGFAEPVGVYGDGTNIYETVTPLAIPTDVAPTPDTYVLRSNAGYVFATYFNQNSAQEAGAAFVNAFIDSGDGYLRKKPFANVQAELGANMPLSGTPTAPTAAPGTATTQVATTAFVTTAAGGSAFGGYVPSNGIGAILSGAGWSASRIGTGRYLVNYDAPIPNGLFMATTATVVAASSNGCRVESPGVSGFIVQTYVTSTGSATDSAFFFNSRRIA